jgi:hypothetical protein
MSHSSGGENWGDLAQNPIHGLGVPDATFLAAVSRRRRFARKSARVAAPVHHRIGPASPRHVVPWRVVQHTGRSKLHFPPRLGACDHSVDGRYISFTIDAGLSRTVRARNDCRRLVTAHPSPPTAPVAHSHRRPSSAQRSATIIRSRIVGLQSGSGPDVTAAMAEPISADNQYSVRCNTKGRPYNMAFDHNGSSHKEISLPYYMMGDVIREGRPQPNNVPYLSQGCGAQNVYCTRRRIWAGDCFARTFRLDAVC